MSGTDIATTPESESAPLLRAIGSPGLHEFIRYTLASVAALCVDISILWLLTSIIGISYLLAGAIAFLLGLTLIYVLSISWVFEHRTVTKPWAEFSAFALIGLIGLGINELVLWLFTGVFGFYYLLSKLASVVFVFSWNFGARKWILFR